MGAPGGMMACPSRRTHHPAAAVADLIALGALITAALGAAGFVVFAVFFK